MSNNKTTLYKTQTMVEDSLSSSISNASTILESAHLPLSPFQCLDNPSTSVPSLFYKSTDNSYYAIEHPKDISYSSTPIHKRRLQFQYNDVRDDDISCSNLCRIPSIRSPIPDEGALSRTPIMIHKGGLSPSLSATLSVSAVSMTPVTSNIHQAKRKIIDNDSFKSAKVKSSKLWSHEDDNILRTAISIHGEQWGVISTKYFNGLRNPTQVHSRWKKVIHPDLKKGKWSEEEDKKLMECMMKSRNCNIKMSWAEISKQIPGRLGKQIKERWNNHLNPDINKEKWSEEEIQTLIRLYQQVGSKWSHIKKYLPGRTEHGIKNKWATVEVQRIIALKKEMETPAHHVTPGSDTSGCTF